MPNNDLVSPNLPGLDSQLPAFAGAGATTPIVLNATMANVAAWRTALAKLKGGAADVVRIAWVCDSKGAGAGAGTGSLRMDGAYEKSVASCFGAALAADGWFIRDSWFGAAGLSSLAAVMAYDPRRSGFAGWGGGTISLGGAALAAGNAAGVGNFQPSRSVDRHSAFVSTGTGGGQLRVAKGSESFTVNTFSASPGFARVESAFVTKSADPIQYSWASGGFVNVVGGVAWDSAQPGIENANFSIYGTTSAVQASTAAPASPLNALRAYAPHLAFIKLGTNDLNTGVAMGTWEANISAIVATVKLTGTPVVIWPSIGGVSPAYGSDAIRAVWRATALRIALQSGALFLDEEALLGGRAGAAASGALPDSLHAAYWAQLFEATTHHRALRQ